MKILLDTNVLIAAFIARGGCSELLEYCARNHVLVTSDFIFQEFREKLTQKFKLDPLDIEEAVKLLSSRMVMVQPVAPVEDVCRDRDDDNILAAALEGGCHCLISGDKDLLVLKQHRGIDILSPGDFWKYEAGHLPR